MQDLGEFTQFFLRYIKERLVEFGERFEKIKDVAVALLIVKRGKYSSSFLNTSFFLLVISGAIVAPSIADNNPLISSLEFNNQSQKSYQAAVVAYNPYENPLSTVISDRPRDASIDYKVQGGDTLASIAKKFNISIDTIRWANNLKSDTLKPNQALSIPPETGIVHKVQSGENIYSIAKKYNVDAQNILNWPYNTFADLETFSLTPGQTIFVPNGTVAEEKTAPKPVFAQAQAGVKGTSNFIWPTTGIITTYPVSWHMALDIANSSAPPILAADTGTVVFSGCINWGYGCHIIIDHGNGYQTLYGHMSRLDVQAGQTVSQGQQIGIMGSTGRSTGTHCHFEIRSGGTLLNPLNFLK